MATPTQLSAILRSAPEEIVNEWTREQIERASQRELLRESDLRQQCREFLELFRAGVESGHLSDINISAWTGAREFLANLSRARAQRGFTPTETAMFVFALKRPLLKRLSAGVGQDAASLFDLNWTLNELLDKLGLFTTEVFQKGREEVIIRQTQEMLELSTPVVKLWQGVLALPIIGTLDSARTQVVMETLLQEIVNTGSQIAIIDITGVPTVDTLVAQHLMKTVAAARLMGAECILSGIRPQIAQTIVHLAVDLGNIATKATLADAFALAVKRLGSSGLPPIVQSAPPGAVAPARSANLHA
jgi:rsbT co-antagonist protein RsbR